MVPPRTWMVRGALVRGQALSTPRTRLVLAEPLELGREDLLDGPADQGLAHVDGQGFHGIEVEVEPRPFIAISPPDNNFSPPVGDVAKLGQIVRPTPGERHDEFVLELGERAKSGKSA